VVDLRLTKATKNLGMCGKCGLTTDELFNIIYLYVAYGAHLPAYLTEKI